MNGKFLFFQIDSLLYFSIFFAMSEVLHFENQFRHVPGGPVVKTPCFHCRGHGFNPWSGKKDPASRMLWPKRKSSRKQERKNTLPTSFFKKNSLGILLLLPLPLTLRISSPPCLLFTSMFAIPFGTVITSCLFKSFLTGFHVTFGSVYMSVLLSHFTPASSSPHLVSSSPFCMSASLFLPCH